MSLLTQATIEDAPECLNTNDKAMWVLGYNDAQAAVIKKLAGANVEPVLWQFKCSEMVSPYAKDDSDDWSPLYTAEALAAARVHALNDAANLSPGGLDVSASDRPATVWGKYSAGVRALINSPK